MRQVLKVVLFNIFINDVEERIGEKPSKCGLSSSSYKMSSNRDNHPFSIHLTNMVECFSPTPLNQLSRLTNGLQCPCKSY